MRYLWAAGFLSTIVAANWATSTWGLVPVGFGLYATAGTFFAALAFVFRDGVQDKVGRRWAIPALIVVGALLSAFVSPSLALASGAAFLISESVDWGIYTPLRKRGYLTAAFASNVVGSLVDTVVFLWIAGFGLSALPGQMVVKLGITTLGMGVVRALHGDAVEPRGAGADA